MEIRATIYISKVAVGKFQAAESAMKCGIHNKGNGYVAYSS